MFPELKQQEEMLEAQIATIEEERLEQLQPLYDRFVQLTTRSDFNEKLPKWITARNGINSGSSLYFPGAPCQLRKTDHEDHCSTFLQPDTFETEGYRLIGFTMDEFQTILNNILQELDHWEDQLENGELYRHQNRIRNLKSILANAQHTKDPYISSEQTLPTSIVDSEDLEP